MTTRRIVLDTNVCLDLFVFADVHSNELMHMLEDGELTAVTRENCRDEWLRVLSSPAFSLDDVAREKCAAAYDKIIDCRNFERKDYARLPLCTDQDDQKFLELAYDAEAEFLITKDKALLKLSGKMRKLYDIRIISPVQSHLIASFLK
ncbi:MAG: putative toxin-antitoxin system toxin component, PIN family [Burkholderiaceae bacterium]|jgi:putative PIN family toxin of toxin-antitoxin system|nr:putative toxin-antitoxin system toxin component, PIN family [Burkholderiaceae bacterium]